MYTVAQPGNNLGVNHSEETGLNQESPSIGQDVYLSHGNQQDGTCDWVIHTKHDGKIGETAI